MNPSIVAGVCRGDKLIELFVQILGVTNHMLDEIMPDLLLELESSDLDALVEKCGESSSRFNVFLKLCQLIRKRKLSLLPDNNATNKLSPPSPKTFRLHKPVNSVSKPAKALVSSRNQFHLSGYVGKNYYCGLCDVCVPDLSIWQSHLCGKGHISKLNAASDTVFTICEICSLHIVGSSKITADIIQCREHLELDESLNGIPDPHKVIKHKKSTPERPRNEQREVVGNTEPNSTSLSGSEVSSKSLTVQESSLVDKDAEHPSSTTSVSSELVNMTEDPVRGSEANMRNIGSEIADCSPQHSITSSNSEESFKQPYKGANKIENNEKNLKEILEKATKLFADKQLKASKGYNHKPFAAFCLMCNKYDFGDRFTWMDHVSQQHVASDEYNELDCSNCNTSFYGNVAFIKNYLIALSSHVACDKIFSKLVN